MKDCDLNDSELKIAVTNKLNGIQENSERQLSELRNKIIAQVEYFTEEIETIKKNQTELLTWRCMRNALENIGNREDEMEERIGEFKDRNLEMTGEEEEREQRIKKIEEFYEDYLTPLERAT